MTNLSQYPCPPGNRNQALGTFAGPTSYTQITTGSPPTGGFPVTAQSLGLVSIEWAECSLSDDGQYGAMVIYDNNPAADVSQVRLLFFIAATGAQVAGNANLSARTFRMLAFGL